MELDPAPQPISALLGQPTPDQPIPMNVAYQSDAIQRHFGEGNRDSQLLEPDGTAESHGMKADYSPENPKSPSPANPPDS